VSHHEELAKLAAQYRLGSRSLDDVIKAAFTLGCVAYARATESAQQGWPSVYRVVGPGDEPVDRRAWTQSGPATLALRHSGRGGRVQEGKVIWMKEE
jgi:hypothetical protein